MNFDFRRFHFHFVFLIILFRLVVEREISFVIIYVENIFAQNVAQPDFILEMGKIGKLFELMNFKKFV